MRLTSLRSPAMVRPCLTGELIIANQVDHDATSGAVTVVTVTPDASVHENESPLLPIAYGDDVMMRWRGPDGDRVQKLWLA